MPAEPEDGAKLLRTGEADVALSIETTFAKRHEDDLDVVTLLDDPMYIMLPRDHPMAARSRLKLADLVA